MRHLDTSNELILQRWLGGVRLLRPDTAVASQKLLGKDINSHSLGSIFQLPFNIYFLDANSALQNSSFVHADMMGFDAVNTSIGLSVFDMADYANASRIRHNDLITLKSYKMNIVEEEATLKNGIVYQNSLSIKFPWYNSNNKAIGVFGCSVILGKQNLADALSQMSVLGLLSSNLEESIVDNSVIDGVFLSTRERECVSLLVKGKTAKEIGKIMKLSHRTVEHYLATVKTKLNVSSKSELIDKVFSYFIG